MRNKRFPKYPDDTDYTTNSPSYYDDLARKQKLIEMLAKKIWEYEETLDLTLEEITNRLESYIDENDNLMTDRLEQWDLNLEKFPENVELLLQEWLTDGTLDHIINETIFSWKADQSDLDETNAHLEKISLIPDDKKESEQDDTERLKRVLLKASKERGANVILEGEYYVSETLYVPAFVNLYSSGGAVVYTNNNDMGTLLSVGYANSIENITFVADELFKGSVLSLTTKDIMNSYDRQSLVFNHNYAPSQIRLKNIKIFMNTSGYREPLATALDIFGNGSDKTFDTSGGLYGASFNDLAISGHFKTGIKIHRSENASTSWIHNMLFDNLVFKGCNTDIDISDTGSTSFFRNVISQPIANRNEWLVKLKNVDSIIFDNIFYWDSHYLEDDTYVLLDNVRYIQFNNTTFYEKNIDYTNVELSQLSTISVNKYIEENYNVEDGIKQLVLTGRTGRSRPYYDKVFTVRIPKSDQEERTASVNFDITGFLEISEVPYANITLYFQLPPNTNEITSSSSKNRINIHDPEVEFDRTFLLDNHRHDERYAYVDVVLKTTRTNTGFTTIKIPNRIHQQRDTASSISSSWGVVIPHANLNTQAPTVEIPIEFNNLENQIASGIFHLTESRILDMTTGRNTVNSFFSGKGIKILLADVTIKGLRNNIKESDYFNHDKTVAGTYVNVSIDSSKDISDVEIIVTAIGVRL